MKESHYNMYIKNVETLDSTMGHHCAAASITTKNEPQFLYLPGAPNSLNPPLYIILMMSSELLGQSNKQNQQN